MTPSASDPIRLLVQALLALTDLSQRAVATQAEVHRPNLVGWLAGKDKVLSLENQVKVLTVLGWQEGGLRATQVHYWQVDASAQYLKQLLTILKCPYTPILVHVICGIDTRDLLVLPGSVLVVVRRPPCVESMPDIATLLGESITVAPQPIEITRENWSQFWRKAPPLTTPVLAGDFIASQPETLRHWIAESEAMQQKWYFDELEAEEDPDMDFDAWYNLFLDAKSMGVPFDDLEAAVQRWLRDWMARQRKS